MIQPLAPLASLFESSDGPALPLPPALAELYGRLSFPVYPHRPTVYANFVSTLDGVVSLSIPGQAGGGPISGGNQHDRLVMGLLRAAADAVIVGAGTVRDVGRHLWTAGFAYPPLAAAFGELRAALGLERHPLNVLVTGSGNIDLERLRLQEEQVPVLITTTAAGARRLAAGPLPHGVELAVLSESGPLSPRAILAEVTRRRPSQRILTEGGPRLMADFLSEGAVDELFLTLAPQLAGRDPILDKAGQRPGLVTGRHFAPDSPRWSRLISARQAGSHLFLRYRFDPPD
ncbi:MAG: dihydrofolate reductase family protein [Anaerolineales bacterium]